MSNSIHSKTKLPASRLPELVIIAAALLIYALTARLWMPGYVIKSLVKVIFFVAVPLLYGRLISHDLSWLKVSRRDAKVLRVCRLLLIWGLSLIVLFWLLARPLGNLFGVAEILAEIADRTGAGLYSLIFTFLYIPVFNASTEEIFFRGFILGKIRPLIGDKAASMVSAGIFAAYHLIIFRSWFNLPLLLVVLSGLILAGLFLNHLTIKYQSLLPAWLIHGLTNLAIFAVAVPFLQDRY